MEFPQVLLELKKKNGYTNAYIGNACGVSESAVRTWLSGKKTPSSAALKSLSLLFNVSTDYLLGNEEKTPANTGERVISDDDIMFALWGDTTDVDEDDLDDVKRYAAFVRERKKKK